MDCGARTIESLKPMAAIAGTQKARCAHAPENIGGDTKYFAISKELFSETETALETLERDAAIDPERVIKQSADSV